MEKNYCVTRGRTISCIIILIDDTREFKTKPNYIPQRVE